MESTNNYYIVQEFCDGGDLRGYLNKKGVIPEKEGINIIAQVCNGFVEILKEGVIHRYKCHITTVILNHRIYLSIKAASKFATSVSLRRVTAKT
jgi:hypothetical protein